MVLVSRARWDEQIKLGVSSAFQNSILVGTTIMMRRMPMVNMKHDDKEDAVVPQPALDNVLLSGGELPGKLWLHCHQVQHLIKIFVQNI